MDTKESHFKYVFWFISVLSGIIMAYIAAATFIELPEKSVRFVDSNIGYFQNILVAVVSYFVGASIDKSKNNTDNNKPT
jgi:hypothetical protein